ncbi:PTS galactosamine/N-acetylgalactosamine transporter subunit IIA [Psittacicella hinzii]|uniref:PTS EIIA type-4 domain-containing protein n=1 Tax=Psittacicella hinzii TaxID=2028575 RepID=A0A3A1YNI9_9GAMM|nr:PTS galactosamine/N-acetylgalactosamine transporter subunit IIA [Psittacicella hinzii]RIY39245.1 hypothetical protein CKF58_02565 [Psittacicella hinzii]
MIGVIVTGHILFATGMQSAVQAVVGEAEQVAFVDFKEEYSPDTLEQVLRQAIAQVDTGDGVLMLTDLFGGTPNNVGVKLLFEYPQLEIVCGANLPMVITAVLEREDVSLEELVETVSAPEITQIKNVRPTIVAAQQAVSELADDEDGI